MSIAFGLTLVLVGVFIGVCIMALMFMARESDREMEIYDNPVPGKTPLYTIRENPEDSTRI